MEFPAPPNLSKTPRKGGKLLGFGPEEIILSELAFHVLKALSRINPNMGAMSARMISFQCGISEDDALHCVKELSQWKYIRIAILAPGDYQSDYAITQMGRAYVLQHAK